ncbi:cobalt ECF transporter T component CbiQ [Methanoplanus limicola]|uniref:Cobalt ABC transporter, inner membrane subunit CbiQ n=1 Tax=Methanoplanus limicola DSM 2279 TaxID=937775 RepID=H1Z469_9EURY|nr:cobalt ECF transporter T component CbiQ [Methanoplanus limicola]EHQ35748.1 cobalt ABC transporter, inner membrane subunit CbiQ [Methanoplanus limicola DSM 2279]
MIEELFNIEKMAAGTSPVHRLDSRVKIILAFSVIIAMVAYPYSRDVFYPGIAFFLIFISLWFISGLTVKSYLKRLIMVLPFGIFIIVFQIFFKNSYYGTFTPVIDLPLGIYIYAESIEFASILLVKFLICISFIILLSSTTTMQDILKGARRLGLPPEFALVIGLMIRYLFVFAEIYNKIKNVFETRCFNAFDWNLPHKYRLRVLSYAIGTLLLRSYEQGERTYLSMLCRGYSKDTYVHLKKKSLKKTELLLVAGSLLIVVLIPAVTYFVLN